MSRLFNKFLLLGFLSYFVYLTVDFSSQEFDPIKSQVSSSWNHVKGNKYYNDYLVATHKKIEPYYVDISQNYVAPSYNKAHSTVVDKYNVYLSAHINNLVSKVVDSPAFDKVLVYRPQFEQYYAIVEAKAKTLNLLAIRYTAIGIKKAFSFICQTYTIALEKFHIARPVAIDFYNNKAVPYSKVGYFKASEWLVLARGHGYNAVSSIKKFSLDVYNNQVLPLYNQHVAPVIQPLYDQHLKSHVDIVYKYGAKYYGFLQIEKVVSFFSSLYSSAYEQIIKYGESTVKNINDKSTVATSDSETIVENQTTEQSIPSAEITPESVETGEIIEAPETELPSDTESISPSSVEATVTATQTGDSTEAENVVNEKEVQTKDQHEGEITLSLADEITAWSDFIDTTVDNIFKNFDKQVLAVESEKIDNFIKPEITRLLSNLSLTAQVDYMYIGKVIMDINSTTAILENGQEVELNEAGNIVDHKISRQEIRDLLAEKAESLKVIADSINVKLQSFVSELEEEVEVERKLIVDIFEEFAEVAINEFSKKMMYSTYSNSFKKINKQELQDDDENFADWREYVKAKNHLIKKREELIAKKTDFSLVKQQLRQVGFHLKELERESGSGLAISRAKANLAFQAREAREREQEKVIEEGGEITQTKLQYVTAVLGDDGIITPGEVSTETTPLSQETQATIEAKVDQPIRSFVQQSELVSDKAPAVDIPVRSYAQIKSETTQEVKSEEDLIGAVEDAVEEHIEAEGELESNTIYESMAQAEAEGSSFSVSTASASATASAVVEDAEEDETVAQEEDDQEQDDGEDSDEQVSEDEETKEAQNEDENEEDIVEHEPDSDSDDENKEAEDVIQHKPDTQ